MATLKDVLAARTREGELYHHLDNGWVHCYACGHNCKIPEGALGVCKVRFNEGGRLMVPWGYAGGVQCDPDREEAVLPRPSRRARLQLRHARLRSALRLLPELGHVAGAARSARRGARRSTSRRRARARRASRVGRRSSSAPTTSRSSRASGRWRSSRRRAPRA